MLAIDSCPMLDAHAQDSGQNLYRSDREISSEVAVAEPVPTSISCSSRKLHQLLSSETEEEDVDEDNEMDESADDDRESQQRQSPPSPPSQSKLQEDDEDEDEDEDDDNNEVVVAVHHADRPEDDDHRIQIAVGPTLDSADGAEPVGHVVVDVASANAPSPSHPEPLPAQVTVHHPANLNGNVNVDEATPVIPREGVSTPANSGDAIAALPLESVRPPRGQAGLGNRRKKKYEVEPQFAKFHRFKYLSKSYQARVYDSVERRIKLSGNAPKPFK